MTYADNTLPSDPPLGLENTEDIRALLRPPQTPGSIPAPPPDTDAPEVVAVELESLQPGWSREAACCDEHVLYVVLDGRLSVSANDDEFSLASSEGILLTAGTEHSQSVTSDRETQRIVVSFRWEGLNPGLPFVLQDGAGRLRELVQWLLVERQAVFNGADRYRSDVVRLLLSESQRLAIDSSGVLEKRLRAYVLEHVDEPISLEDLAKHVGMGRFHLCRKYRKLTGHPPMHAVRAIRMEQARELIRTTRLPLRVVAKRVALRSEQHLSRLLKVHFGVGVRELRAASCNVPDLGGNGGPEPSDNGGNGRGRAEV
jgi:AraC-like DNA-binding protein